MLAVVTSEFIDLPLTNFLCPSLSHSMPDENALPGTGDKEPVNPLKLAKRKML